MIKKLILLRHAKSSWKETELSDFDRPLAKRGLKDLELMCNNLPVKKLEADIILSSPSKRTSQTVNYFTKKFPNLINIKFDESIYAAHFQKILELVKSLSNDFNSVMIAGHNPGLTDLTNYLTKDFIDNIPTCGIISLQSENEWKNFCEGCCKVEFFYYPKQFK